MISATEKELLEQAIRVITGPDLDYYPCTACHEKYQHTPDCLVIKLRKVILKKPRKAVKTSAKR